MNIIVHYPTKAEAKEQLAKRVSEAHCRAVVDKVLKLSIERQEKIRYLEEIQTNYT